MLRVSHCWQLDIKLISNSVGMNSWLSLQWVSLHWRCTVCCCLCRALQIYKDPFQLGCCLKGRSHCQWFAQRQSNLHSFIFNESSGFPARWATTTAGDATKLNKVEFNFMQMNCKTFNIVIQLSSNQEHRHSVTSSGLTAISVTGPLGDSNL